MNSNNSNNISLTNILQNTLTNTLKTFLVSNNSIKLKSSKWTPDQDVKLKNLIQEKGSKNWKKVAEYFENKTPIQCFYRWNKIIKTKIEWTEEEIKKLSILVQKYGNSNWTNCAKYLKGKSPKSCKDKWQQISDENDGTWTNLDETYLLLSVNAYGTCWSKISKLFPTHLENSVKNKFYSILKKIANEKLNSTSSTKISINDLKLGDLLIFLPNALINYRQLIGEDVYNSLSLQFQITNIPKCESDIINLNNTSNSQINICSVCKDKLKEIIKKNLLSNMLKKSLCDYNITDDMNGINSLEKLKNTSQKIEKLKEILNDVNKNILNFN
jgi:hypothetical protein